MFCNRCGRPLPQGATSCPACGAPVSQEGAQGSSPTQWAQPGGYPSQQPGGYPNQQPGGYPQQPGGYPQQPGGYPPPAQGGYPSQMGYQQGPYRGPQQGFQGGFPAQQQTKPGGRKKGLLILIIVLCSVLVLAAAGVGGYFLVKGRHSAAPAGSSSSSKAPTSSGSSAAENSARVRKEVEIPALLKQESTEMIPQEEYLPTFSFFEDGHGEMYLNYSEGMTTVSFPYEVYYYGEDSYRMIKCGPCPGFEGYSGSRARDFIYLMEIGDYSWHFSGQNVGMTMHDAYFDVVGTDTVTAQAAVVNAEKKDEFEGTWIDDDGSVMLSVMETGGGEFWVSAVSPLMEFGCFWIGLTEDACAEGFVEDYDNDSINYIRLELSGDELLYTLENPYGEWESYRLEKEESQESASAGGSTAAETIYSLPVSLTGYYQDDGSVYQQMHLSYDAEGNIQSYNRFCDGISEEWYYFYSSSGNLEEAVYYRDGDYLGGFTGTYDAAGRAVKEEHFNADGQTLYWYEYFYGSDGRRSKEVIHQGLTLPGDAYDGETILYHYDAAGNLVTVQDTTADGTILYELEAAYDAEGKVMWIEDTPDSLSNEAFSFEYDEGGRMNAYTSTQKRVDWDNDYDVSGGLTEQTYYFSGTGTVASIREYKQYACSTFGTVRDLMYYEVTVDGVARTELIPIWQGARRPLLDIVNLVVYGCL